MSNVSKFQIFLTKMCCCTSLKTGTLIIGVLDLLGSVVLIFVSISLMAQSTVSANICKREL